MRRPEVCVGLWMRVIGVFTVHFYGAAHNYRRRRTIREGGAPLESGCRSSISALLHGREPPTVARDSVCGAVRSETGLPRRLTDRYSHTSGCHKDINSVQLFRGNSDYCYSSEITGRA